MMKFEGENYWVSINVCVNCVNYVNPLESHIIGRGLFVKPFSFHILGFLMEHPSVTNNEKKIRR
jgi:hypothetical protein